MKTESIKNSLKSTLQQTGIEKATSSQFQRFLTEQFKLYAENKEWPADAVKYVGSGSAFSDMLTYFTLTLNQKFVIHIPEVGNLIPRHRNARIGRNPKSKEPHQIPAKTRVYLNRVGGLKQSKGKRSRSDIAHDLSLIHDNLSVDMWLVVFDVFSVFISQIKDRPMSIKLHQFGVFESVNHARNERLVLVAKFRPAKKMIEAINKTQECID